MKLELKHLVPYLPYGLGVQILNHKCDYVGIEFSKANGFYLLNGALHMTYEGGSTGKSISEFKPILRPMSDLDVKFEIAGVYKKGWDHLHSHADFFTGLPFDVVVAVIEKRNLDTIPMYVAEWLFEYDFDVFGLIDQGLAIDINTLNK